MTTTYQYEIIVGNDNGNSEHDIIIDGKLIQQPNVMAKIKKLPNLEEVSEDYVIKHIEDNLITTIDSPGCEPGIYYVGNYATKSGRMLRNIEVGAENSKLDADVIVVNTLSQIAGYVVQKAYNENKDLSNTIQVNVDMATSLPVTQYNKETSKLFANKFMDDKHKITVHVGTSRVNVEINFTYVKVNPESVPVVFYLQRLTRKALDKIENEEEKAALEKRINKMFAEFNTTYNKNIDGSYFRGRILHASIGEGTTEYPLTEDIEFNPNFIVGSNNGVGHAINAVLNDFIQKKKLVKFSRQDFSNVLKNKNHKYHKDALDMIEVPLEEQAEVILRYLKQQVARANNEVDIICVHGGGSVLMKDFIYNELKKFGNATNIEIFYAPEEYAVILEALGLYEFAQSKIFTKLKEVHLKKKQEQK